MKITSENILKKLGRKTIIKCSYCNKDGLLCSTIKDAGLTEFRGVPTLTTAAIGPDESSKIDEITEGLPLL